MNLLRILAEYSAEGKKEIRGDCHEEGTLTLRDSLTR